MIDTQSKLGDALREAVATLGADSGTIHLKEAGRLTLTLAASCDLPESVLEHVREIPWGKGLAGVAAERGEPVDYCNLQTSHSSDIHPRTRATGMRGAIVVPMLYGHHVVGTIGIGCRSERTFSAEEIDWLLDLGRRLADEYGDKSQMAA